MWMIVRCSSRSACDRIPRPPDQSAVAATFAVMQHEAGSDGVSGRIYREGVVVHQEKGVSTDHAFTCHLINLIHL